MEAHIITTRLGLSEIATWRRSPYVRGPWHTLNSADRNNVMEVRGPQTLYIPVFRLQAPTRAQLIREIYERITHLIMQAHLAIVLDPDACFIVRLVVATDLRYDSDSTWCDVGLAIAQAESPWQRGANGIPSHQTLVGAFFPPVINDDSLRVLMSIIEEDDRVPELPESHIPEISEPPEPAGLPRSRFELIEELG